MVKEVEVTKHKCPYCGVTLDTFDVLKAHVTAEHPAEVGVTEPAFESEETFIRDFGMNSHGGGSELACVDVKNGRIVRIRPLHYEEKYTREEISPWKIEARGKTFEPLMKGSLSYFALAYKKRIYSPNRIKFPLKRVDWDPNGDRNPQNRGMSKYKRISWDEATDIIASEIKRVQADYGPYAILCQGDGHGESKTVHGPHSCQMRLLQHMGGYTLQVRNPDSWEGWYWGAMHVWGTQAVGLLRSKTSLRHLSENADMIVWQGGDPLTTSQTEGQLRCRMVSWFKELGIKQVFICPDLNYSAAVYADKWIPVLPNTDAALQLAIAYIWITEGTYDKDYVATHVVGFDKFSDYVMGKEDGIPKTPEWASPKCSVPEWTIKALAREWASKRTSVGHNTGGCFIRGPYSHEPARLEVCLLGMQGLGKPGVTQFDHTPSICKAVRPDTRAAWTGGEGRQGVNKGVWTGGLDTILTPQFIPKTMIHHAILNPPITHWGTTAIEAKVEDQFVKYTYPIPKEDGGTEIHMIWTDTPCRTACWNNGYLTIEAFRSPKIECVVAQHPWLENDCLISDIILPANTKVEEEDILGCGGQLPSIYIGKQAIKPLGESLSDYEIVGEVAKKLNKYEEYTEGKSVEEWIKYGYEFSGVKDIISWEELNDKGYWISPSQPWPEDEEPVGLLGFYEDPEKNPLGTPSGKLEFYSERLAKHFPDDKERPPSAKWVVGGPGWTHDESLSGERKDKYPLLLVSNHPRWRFHVEFDDVPWLREIPTCKVKGYDGYIYEPVWIHPVDAAKRSIDSGDIVKVYNDRGVVLSGAYVTERIIPRAVYQDHGARLDPINDQLDRGGSNNLISPEKGISQHCWGQATSGFLVEVEKVDPGEMEEWRKKYPEAFARDYDPASGLRFNAWVEGGI